MQITLTRVSITDKNKEGQPLVTKKGKPYRKIGIQTKEHGDKWLTGFLWEQGDEMESWQAGQQVNILVEKNGQYLNFKVPNKTDLLEERVSNLEKQVASLLRSTVESDTEYSKRENGSEEIPF